MKTKGMVVDGALKPLEGVDYQNFARVVQGETPTIRQPVGAGRNLSQVDFLPEHVNFQRLQSQCILGT